MPIHIDGTGVVDRPEGPVVVRRTAEPDGTVRDRDLSLGTAGALQESPGRWGRRRNRSAVRAPESSTTRPRGSSCIERRTRAPAEPRRRDPEEPRRRDPSRTRGRRNADRNGGLSDRRRLPHALGHPAHTEPQAVRASARARPRLIPAPARTDRCRLPQRRAGQAGRCKERWQLPHHASRSATPKVNIRSCWGSPDRSGDSLMWSTNSRVVTRGPSRLPTPIPTTPDGRKSPGKWLRDTW